MRRLELLLRTRCGLMPRTMITTMARRRTDAALTWGDEL